MGVQAHFRKKNKKQKKAAIFWGFFTAHFKKNKIKFGSLKKKSFFRSAGSANAATP